MTQKRARSGAPTATSAAKPAPKARTVSSVVAPRVAPAEVTPTRRKPGPRPGTEAARRGGTAAREKYGKEFYARIGAKGGATVRERRGSSFYTEIGRRGGEATKRNLGTDHYSRIGRIGGQRAHGRRGPATKAAK